MENNCSYVTLNAPWSASRHSWTVRRNHRQIEIHFQRISALNWLDPNAERRKWNCHDIEIDRFFFCCFGLVYCRTGWSFGKIADATYRRLPYIQWGEKTKPTKIERICLFRFFPMASRICVFSHFFSFASFFHVTFA